MDKASLLFNAVSYINKLKSQVDELESQVQRESKKEKIETGDNLDNQSTTTSLEQTRPPNSSVSGSTGFEIEVKIVGSDAMIGVHSANVNYPSARLMTALHDLEFEIHHASLSCMNELMLQHVMVKMPDNMRSKESIKAAAQQPHLRAHKASTPARIIRSSTPARIRPLLQPRQQRRFPVV
ncbi:hypothetical protein FF1_018288 [Malus domestica]